MTATVTKSTLFVHEFSAKVAQFGLSGAILSVANDNIVVNNLDPELWHGRIRIEQVAHGLSSWISTAGPITVSVAVLFDDEVLIGLASVKEDGFGYVVNLLNPACSEWGYGARLS